MQELMHFSNESLPASASRDTEEVVLTPRTMVHPPTPPERNGLGSDAAVAAVNAKVNWRRWRDRHAAAAASRSEEDSTTVGSRLLCCVVLRRLRCRCQLAG